MKSHHYRIAILSGKLADVDGVSLEVDKWITVLQRLGHTLFTIAGTYPAPVSDVSPENQFTLPALRFDSKEQHRFERRVFPYLMGNTRSTESAEDVENEILNRGCETAAEILEILQENQIDLLIAENTNAMPMSLIAGAAIHQLAAEERIAVLFHHHDFWWERSRFSSNRIEGLLNRIMPPVEPGLEHAVISSYAAHMLRTFKRIQPSVVPNCEDFARPPVPEDYNRDFRASLGFAEDDLLFVQPTRIVPRKRIEDSIRLTGAYARRYPDQAERIRLVISLYQGDEMDEAYMDSIRELARKEGVDLRLIAERVASIRGTDQEGRKIFTNRDVLVHADLVLYLPLWEGYGNAYLEAIAARKPVVISTYLVYKTDIKGLGFKNIEIRDEYDTDGNLHLPEAIYPEIHRILNDSVYRNQICDYNFTVGERELSLDALSRKLDGILTDYQYEIQAAKIRREKRSRVFSV